MRRAILPFAALLVGCSSQTVGPSGLGGAGGATTSTTASASSSSSASGSGGAGGSFNPFTDAGPGTCPVAAGGGCAGATLFFDLTIDDGTPKQLTFDCGLTGHLVGGGGPAAPPTPPPDPSSGGLLHIEPSSSQTGDWILLSGDMPSLPGAITTGYTRYTQSSSEYETPQDDATLSITSFTVVGEVIEGSFAASVTRTWGDAGPGTASIHGQFRVCRAPDEILP